MDYSAGLSCTPLIVSPDGWNQDWGGVSKSVKEANLKWHWPAKSDHFPLQKMKNFQGGPKGRKLNLIIPFDQPVLVADLLHHVGLPQAVAVAQPAITLVCSTIIIRAPFGIHGNSHDRCNQLITINLSSWFLICVEILTNIPMKLWCQIWQRHLIEALDDVLKPSALQLLPDPVGHVETGCLKGLNEDGCR